MLKTGTNERNSFFPYICIISYRRDNPNFNFPSTNSYTTYNTTPPSTCRRLLDTTRHKQDRGRPRLPYSSSHRRRWYSWDVDVLHSVHRLLNITTNHNNWSCTVSIQRHQIPSHHRREMYRYTWASDPSSKNVSYEKTEEAPAMMARSVEMVKRWMCHPKTKILI